MSLSTIVLDQHSLYLESRLSEEQARYKVLIECERYADANISLRMINEFQYQISELSNQENIVGLLNECLVAIESGQIINYGNGMVYEQTFGQAFVDRLKKALNK